MLCPHCGPHGRMEQIGFGPEYEVYFCHVCGVRYVAYAIGDGELTEPVPMPGPVPPHGHAAQPHA
ncbi:MAG: hypothetical protein IRZ10_05495 [Thermoflavifilum sp.]|nr:hypothetical protein [Thermoflavifilum sp.]MCL6513857.1 hypothetical protein [Alicyclobacillus sp.]